MKTTSNTGSGKSVSASPAPGKHAIAAFNFVFSTLLRSPLHRLLSRKFLLLSVTGRQSGKMYTFPVSYLDDGDELQIIAVRGWWKNLRGGNAPVTVLLRGQKRKGLAEAWYGDDRVAHEFQRLVQKFPSLIRMYHIERDAQGQPRPESVYQAARALVLVRVRLLEGKNG